jgi:hypothetical protein
VSAPIRVGEHESEPIRGLPELPPAGEEILWQGAPCWRRLARSVFHVDKLAIYFAAMAAWRIGSALSDGQTVPGAAVSAAPLALLGLAALGILTGIAWLQGRTTVYTVTNRRVVMRFGVALDMAVNLPFAGIQSAALRVHRDGTGDIPLSVSDAHRLGYVMLWPHARPWRFGRRVEPMLRAVPDAEAVAETLTRAVGATARRAPSRTQPGGVQGVPVASAVS